MTLLAAALTYAQKHSIHVFPLAPHSKVPLSKHAPRGFLSATVDAATIRRWWTDTPTAGIGIACSVSGVVVIDVDPRNGGDTTYHKLVKELGPLPNTWTSLTGGGGQQFFFRDSVGEYASMLGEGIDIKFNGYVVAPPSTHPNGTPYRWDVSAHPTETPVASLPDAWLNLATERQTKKRALNSSGEDAAKSYLGAAFESLKWLGDVLADGKRMVRCPWLAEHSDGRGDGNDSSTVIFPRAYGHTLGGFLCKHGHCAGRTWKEVVKELPQSARDAGARAAKNLAPPSMWDEAC